MGTKIVQEIMLYVIGGLLIFAYFYMSDSNKKALNKQVSALSAQVSEVTTEKNQLDMDIKRERKLAMTEIRELQESNRLATEAMKERAEDYQKASQKIESLSKQIKELRLKNAAFKTWSDTAHPADVNRLFNAASAGAGKREASDTHDKNNPAPRPDLSL